ncbi:MAG: carboxylating nicotinate-nucleotide diphosphorylase [Rickettsiales bacterium]|nr:carboxylating nicotinate-nucleotide diphosphorylase [Pseudomonadota bacterium]MDA0966090.1 carboxylating nicotinate-nucleotide diphosphorylase [Pseudomonadota bacterium]MDG4544273.1 carboxylating nicotinate-nucleotide diphosphorylase [Rickettsiales bacterium]MDG4546452.1 carboxylating nicotinate-nucleotide diphosphorylase [Rickettsiales bacterium]MDG4548598.1 carboxylating nicotinate-nucleotide diphosphorylase [Rickettsiales bacterium]
MQPDTKEINRIISMSLSEDIGKGDITSKITVPEDKNTKFVIRAREKMVVCGIPIAMEVFKTLSNKIELQSRYNDGDIIKQGDIILQGEGNAIKILEAERVALNLLRQMCGTATLTRKFVDLTKGTKAKILDTRKTIPGLRSIQKYAVTKGGGYNHRFCLDDAILIKDNHISVCGSVQNTLNKAKQNRPDSMKIQIECDTIKQVIEALENGADIILLDNMDNETLARAVKITAGKIPLEASGNVSLKTVRGIAETGVDFISVGAITNSPTSVDIGLDMDFD